MPPRGCFGELLKWDIPILRVTDEFRRDELRIEAARVFIACATFGEKANTCGGLLTIG